MKPDPLHSFLIPEEQPTVDSVLQRRIMQSTLPRDQLPAIQRPPMRRAEMSTFQTTVRERPNVLSYGAPNDYNHTPPSAMQRSLEDVWVKGMASAPAELREIDPTAIGRVDKATGQVQVARYIPERFERGRVQQPRVLLESVDARTVSAEEGRLLTWQERRAQHDAQVQTHAAEAALTEAYRARARLVRTCRKNYPHGALNVVESPFGTDGPMAAVYAPTREQQAHEQRVADRIGKGRGFHRPSVMGEILKGGL